MTKTAPDQRTDEPAAAQHAVRKLGPRSKRNLILEAAVDTFGAHGYEHTKWSSISDQVGIGQTALYHYFESKAHCLLTILSTELEQSLARVRGATAGLAGAEALRAAVASAYDISPREALSARILLSHMDVLQAPRQSEREETERQRSRVLVREIEDEWSAIIQRGMASGDFVERDARQTSLAVLAVVNSVWRSYRPGGNRSLTDITEFVAGACLRLVGP